MYCRNCGKELLEGAKFCQYCSSIQEYNQNQVVIPQQINNKQETTTTLVVDNHKANVLCTISLLLYFSGPVIALMLYLIIATASSSTDVLDVLYGVLSGTLAISSVTGLAAYVLMIVARVKYPKSIYAKVIMWIYIVFFILGIIAFAALIIYCGWYTGNCLHQLGEMG